MNESQCQGCGDVSDSDDMHACLFCGETFCESCFEDGEDGGPVCFACLRERANSKRA